MAWIALALLLLWFVSPFAIMMASSIWPPTPVALQETSRLYICGFVVALGWFILVAVPLTVSGAVRWTPKIAGGLIAWSVIAGMLLAVSVLRLANGRRSGDAGVATTFQHAGGYRRQVSLRALDGPAAGTLFNAGLADIAHAESGRGIYAGKVRRGRLGLWWASFGE